MASKEKLRYQVAATYDTETCNLGAGASARAYPVLFIFDDLRAVDLASYVPDESPERILFYRTWQEAILYLEDLMRWGRENATVPIIAAYNLMFDLQPLLYELHLRNDGRLKVNAQSSTNVYTLDVLDENGKPVLRFWDTFHLEMGGLDAMGITAGLAKASGKWDYSLIRTPQTPLTEKELYYAKRDVQVIAAYLNYLLRANEWLEPDMFGHMVITKTSLVRQMARRVIGRNRVRKQNGKTITLLRLFELTCKQELPPSYEIYATRKACFRGGFTFTSAAYASTVQERVTSWDVTSMHHLFINGRRVPVHWQEASREALQSACEQIARRSIKQVLARYANPFLSCIHARVRFTNLRLKQGSAFRTYGIGLLAQAKFGRVAAHELDETNERNMQAEEDIRAAGFHDSAAGAVFAFGKLYSADVATVYVNELELWNMSRVYEWDAMQALNGELSVKSITPPDYVTLQSNILFSQKTDAKKIANEYHEGKPYAKAIPGSIPQGLAEQLKTGEISAQFLKSWYGSAVKGAFNSVYGTMAQDLLKPDFEFSDAAEIQINSSTRVNAMNYGERLPKRCKVLYNYGMRIVGGSRMHLLIAIELIYRALGDKARITGGDTDSIKIALAPGINPDEVLAALEPLHAAARESIKTCQKRVRCLFPHLASDLEHIGEFELEPASDAKLSYEYHLEAWNKARVSVVDGEAHITCAGLSRPKEKYHIESWLNDMLKREDPRKLLPQALGYNVYISPAISHALEHRRPPYKERFKKLVKDYTGKIHPVDTYASIALYPAGRYIGDTAKRVNAANVAYLKSAYGRELDTSDKTITVKDGIPQLWSNCDDIEIQLL